MHTTVLVSLKFVVGKLISAITNRTIDGAFKAASPFGWRVRLPLHHNELLARVKDMPFIYRDLDSDVLNDFVEIDLKRLTLDTLVPLRSTPSVDWTTLDCLRERRKMLVLGAAGIGKTTFMRHTILSLIENRGRLPRYFDDEYFVPFYVPLKSIDNASPYPILRHLLSNNTLLRGAAGLKVLTKLAERNQLILFIDAYDECPLSAVASEHNRSYLREELNIIIAPGYYDRHVFTDPNYQKFYDNVRICRMWLSSRKEFFLQFPVDLRQRIGQGIGPLSAQTATIVELHGVGSHRTDLVRTIFSKYKDRSKKYEGLLSEELFLQQIDAAEDELVGLSYNPLFLTVMCYVYASKVIEAGTHNVAWGTSVRQLIMECINLLLYDLDEAKTLTFPPAYREAILNRRNQFKEEKLAFLCYFALMSSIDSLAVFSRTSLTGYATRFFQSEPDWPDASVILREIHRPRFGSLSIVDDLIFCGLFVTVDRSADGLLYDFPVRRFREVLAVEYVESLSDVRHIVDKLVTRSDLNEILYLAFATSKFQDVIIEAILEQVGGNDDVRLDLVLRACLLRKPPRYNVTPPVETWLLRCIREEVRFTLSDFILKQLEPGSSFIAELLEEFRKAVEQYRRCAFALCCEILFTFGGGQLLSQPVVRAVASAMAAPGLLPIVLRNGQRDRWRVLVPHIGDILKRPGECAIVSYIVARYYEGTVDDHRFCRIVLSKLDREGARNVLASISKVNVDAAKDLVRAAVLSDEQEVVAAICITWMTRAPKEIQAGYVLTNRMLEQLPSELRSELDQRRGWFFIDLRDLVPDVKIVADTNIDLHTEDSEKLRLESELRVARRTSARAQVAGLAKVSRDVVSDVKALLDAPVITLPEIPEFFGPVQGE